MKKGRHDPHHLEGSGGKYPLGETESQMPKRNMRGYLNDMAGSHDHPKSDTGRGYTDGDKFGPKGNDNMHINKSHKGGDY